MAKSSGPQGLAHAQQTECSILSESSHKWPGLNVLRLQMARARAGLVGAAVKLLLADLVCLLLKRCWWGLLQRQSHCTVELDLKSGEHNEPCLTVK